MHHRPDYDENMEQLMRRAINVELAGKAALGKLGLISRDVQWKSHSPRVLDGRTA